MIKVRCHFRTFQLKNITCDASNRFSQPALWMWHILIFDFTLYINAPSWNSASSHWVTVKTAIKIRRRFGIWPEPDTDEGEESANSQFWYWDMSAHGHATFAMLRLWKKCMHKGLTKSLASCVQLTPKCSFLFEWKLTPNISNVGSQHFQQKPVFALKNGHAQLVLPCLPKHLKHILKIEEQPRPSWCTNDFAIREHKSHAAELDIFFNFRSIVVSFILNSRKLSVPTFTNETFSIRLPSSILDIAWYLSSSEHRLNSISVDRITGWKIQQWHMTATDAAFT
jgi:hypothetical protein